MELNALCGRVARRLTAVANGEWGMNGVYVPTYSTYTVRGIDSRRDSPDGVLDEIAAVAASRGAKWWVAVRCGAVQCGMVQRTVWWEVLRCRTE